MFEMFANVIQGSYSAVIYLFKVNNYVTDVFLGFLMLTLNRFHALFWGKYMKYINLLMMGLKPDEFLLTYPKLLIKFGMEVLFIN